jgi:hypothetical protein
LNERLPRRAIDLDELVEAIDQRIGRHRRRQRTAIRHLLQQRHFIIIEAQDFAHRFGLGLGKLHLPVQRRGVIDRRARADLGGDVAPGKLLLALQDGDLLGELGACHRCLLSSLAAPSSAAPQQ